MIKSKLHNPVIANDSHIENAVVEKSTIAQELVFADIGNAVPVVPEIGRVWFNTEDAVFRFANIDGSTNYIDEFLSRTDDRDQSVVSKVLFKDSITVNNDGGDALFNVNSATDDVTFDGANSNRTWTDNDVSTVGGFKSVGVTGTSSTIVGGAVTETYNSSKTEGVSSNSTQTIGGVYATTVTGNVTEDYNSSKTEDVAVNLDVTVGGTSDVEVTGAVTETYKSTKVETITSSSQQTISGASTLGITGNLTATVGGTSGTTVTGNVTETYSASQQTNITSNLGIKVGQTATLTDASDNVKIQANNIANTLTVNYTTVGVNGQTETHTMSNKFVINDGSTDKYIIDNTNDKVTIIYETLESTNTDVTVNASNSITITDGSSNKIVADHSGNTLSVTYADVGITGNTTVDGNMVITGDLTVGGQTTKVDVSSENLNIADNIITLNSNLTDEDPRLASALVDGEDVDYNAGVAINRGNQGILDLIKWTESGDTSGTESLKEAFANVSIWNYEAATPAYELHQIIDAYTLARQTSGKSGSGWVGYDGEEGTNYANAIADGESSVDALEYSFKLDADSMDDVIDSIVQEIDELKFNGNNTVRVGETPSSGKSFTITHNLGTVFVDVRIQREDNGSWMFDSLPTKVVDANTVLVESTETTKIRYMITAIEGFDVNQATELVIA